MTNGPSLRSSASRLALAGVIEYGLQLAIPILLVRHLDPHTFAQYRLLWLLASTALAIAPAYMHYSLFYFLPRTDDTQKKQLVGNILCFLLVTGTLTGLFTLGWNGLMPRLVADLFFQSHGLSSLFLALWVMTSVLDTLPTADNRAFWQARSTMTLAVLRTVLLSAAAIFSGDIVWILVAMLCTAVAKLTLLALYVRGDNLPGTFSWRLVGMRAQLAYCLPFAAGAALFLLRLQADQWVVASLLTPAEFAAFSISAVFLPMAQLVRQPVNNAMMPRLNAAHERNDTAAIVALVAKSNGAAGLLLIPLVGGLFSVAPQLVELVYTRQYLQAAPVMRVYLISMLITAFAMGHLLSVLNKGRASMWISAVCLVLSIAMSFTGVHLFGMVGGAIGSVSMAAFSEFWALRVAARALNVHWLNFLAWRALASAIFAALVGILGTWFIAPLLPQQLFLLLIAKGAIYSLLFMSSFLLVGGWKILQTYLLRPRNVAT